MSGQYDGDAVKKGLEYLKTYQPGRPRGLFGDAEAQIHYFYGHYYAAQAMWLEGKEAWAEWYPAIRNELLDRQSASGFWIDNGVCNEYGTAMALIILQIPNDYLPIFQR